MPRVISAVEAGLGSTPIERIRTHGLSVGASPADMGANTAQALASVAQGLGDAGQAAATAALVEQQRREREEVLLANKQALEHELEWDQRLAKAQEEAPAGAPGFADQQLKAFREWKEKQLAETKYGPAAKAQLEEDLLRMEGGIARAAHGFEQTARKANAITQLEGAADVAASAVYAKPERYAELLARQRGMIGQSGLAAPDKAKLDQAFTGKLTAAMWTRKAELDPAGTLKLLRSDAETPGLELSDRLRIANGAEVDVRRLEAEARARAAEARAEQARRQAEAQGAARLVYEDELAAASRGETANPEARKIIAGAFGDKAGPLLDRLNRARENAGIAAELATMTPEQIRAKLQERAPQGEGYADEAEDQARLAKLAADVEERRRKDPAAEVIRSFPQARDLLTSGDPAKIAQGLRLSADIQRNTFGLAPHQTQPLPKETADDLVKRFNAATTADEKLGTVAGPTLALGDDAIARRVLDQLEAAGLPAGLDLALERMRQGDPSAMRDARAIVGAMTADPKDAPKLGDATTEQIKSAVDSRFAAESPAGVAAAASAMTGEPSAARNAARAREAVLKLATTYAAAGDDAETAADKALAAIYGGAGGIVDPDLGAVTVPAGADPTALTAGLEALRAGVTLDHLAPKPPGTASEAALSATGGEMRRKRLEYEARLADLRANGRWTDAPGGYVLLNRMGRAVPGPDGRPRVWTLDEVLAAGKGRLTEDVIGAGKFGAVQK